jgi:hypothetical protein
LGAWLNPTSRSQDLGVPSLPYSFPSICSGAWLKANLRVIRPKDTITNEYEASCRHEHPTWEEWEVKSQGLNLADTVQKAALEALTTFCVKRADVVASTAAKVIPLPKQHSRHGIERKAFLSAGQSSP